MKEITLRKFGGDKFSLSMLNLFLAGEMVMSHLPRTKFPSTFDIGAVVEEGLNEKD